MHDCPIPHQAHSPRGLSDINGKRTRRFDRWIDHPVNFWFTCQSYFSNLWYRMIPGTLQKWNFQPSDSTRFPEIFTIIYVTWNQKINGTLYSRSILVSHDVRNPCMPCNNVHEQFVKNFLAVIHLFSLQFLVKENHEDCSCLLAST